SVRTLRGASAPSECARGSKAANCAHTSATSAPTGAPARPDRSRRDPGTALAWSCLAGLCATASNRWSENLREKAPGVGGLLGRHLLGGAGGNHHAALLAALWAPVNQPVGALDPVGAGLRSE